MKSVLKGLFILLALTVFHACSESEESAGGMGRLNVYLSDAPFPYAWVDQANLTVYKVEARRADATETDSSDTSGSGSPYVVLMEEEISVNLLELTGGVTEQLASAEIPAGDYDLVRIYVKDAGVVLQDSTVFDLKVPSGMQSGIKVFLKPALRVVSSLSTDVLLDVDVSRSFVAKGGPNPKGFNFKPVIRAANLTTSGTLQGMVTTVDSTGAVVPLEGAQLSVMASDSVYASTFSDAEGAYAILGLQEGAFSVTASLEGYQDATQEGVVVVAGNRTTQDFQLEIQ